MRKFYLLLKKELRELITIHLIISLVMTMMMFYFLGNVLSDESEKIIKEVTKKTQITILDNDKTEFTKKLIEHIEYNNYEVDYIVDEKIENIVEKMNKKKRMNFVVIPSGFSKNYDDDETFSIEVYTLIKTLSMKSILKTKSMRSFTNLVNNYLGYRRMKKNNPEIKFERFMELKSSLETKRHVHLNNKFAQISPDEIQKFVTEKTTFIPIILFMVIVVASQMIVVSVATEKENKTLETLLCAPISRVSLVASKLTAAGMIAFLSALIYMLGFRHYMNSFTEKFTAMSGELGINAAAAKLGLVLTTQHYVLITLSMFFGILCALSIAVLIGILSENVKSAQGLMAPFMFIIMIPYFLVMFLDIDSVSPMIKYLILAIPFSHPFLAVPSLLLQKTSFVCYGILYEIFICIVFITIAVKIFSSDKILTIKLKLRKSSTN